MPCSILDRSHSLPIEVEAPDQGNHRELSREGPWPLGGPLRHERPRLSVPRGQIGRTYLLKGEAEPACLHPNRQRGNSMAEHNHKNAAKEAAKRLAIHLWSSGDDGNNVASTPDLIGGRRRSEGEGVLGIAQSSLLSAAKNLFCTPPPARRRRHGKRAEGDSRREASWLSAIGVLKSPRSRSLWRSGSPTYYLQKTLKRRSPGSWRDSRSVRGPRAWQLATHQPRTQRPRPRLGRTKGGAA